jgi:hypothetical protein
VPATAHPRRHGAPSPSRIAEKTRCDLPRRRLAQDDPTGRATARLPDRGGVRRHEAPVAIEARSGARTDVTRFVRVGDELAWEPERLTPSISQRREIDGLPSASAMKRNASPDLLPGEEGRGLSQDLLLFKPPDSLAELPELSRRHAVLAFSTDGHPHRVAGSYCDGRGGNIMVLPMDQSFDAHTTSQPDRRSTEHAKSNPVRQCHPTWPAAAAGASQARRDMGHARRESEQTRSTAPAATMGARVLNRAARPNHGSRHRVRGPGGDLRRWRPHRPSVIL